jgi:hypothetical protein
MKILFDQGTPAPLRHRLVEHEVATAHDVGWGNLQNGDLLTAAEAAYEALVTTDKNLRYQQNLSGRRLAILVLPTTSWPRFKRHVAVVVAAVNALVPGAFVELELPE